MNKYRIVYIDEEEKDRQNYSELLSSDNIEVIPIHPNVVEADLINYILDENFDAIIIDHRLYGKDASIKYSGADIVQEIQGMKDKFPSFILTANRDEDEVGDKIEENLIFTKVELANNPQEIQRKISGTIKYYQKVNKELTERLASLTSRRNAGEPLEDDELQEIITLNYEIERRLNKNEILPDLIKDSESLKALNKVIRDASDYLDKIKSK